MKQRIAKKWGTFSARARDRARAIFLAALRLHFEKYFSNFISSNQTHLHELKSLLLYDLLNRAREVIFAKNTLQKCIFCARFVIWAPPCLLYGGLEGFFQPTCVSCWVDTCALTAHSSQLSVSAYLGFARTCSALAVLRGVSEELGTLVVSYSMSTVTWNEHRFRVLGRIPMVNLWGSQCSALAGAGFEAQLLLWSSLRRTCFSVTFVSSALDARIPSGVRVESVHLWILFNLPANLSMPFWCWRLCWFGNNLVDPASSHMLVSKIKPCMSQCKLLYGETANGSLKQL